MFGTEHLLKKPLKKPKHHNRKTTNSWTKMFPKNVLNFPHHLPINLLGEHSRMLEHSYHGTETVASTTSTRLPIETTATRTIHIPENILNSNTAAENFVKATSSAIIPPTLSTTMSHTTTEQESKDITDKLRNITAKPIIIDTGTTGSRDNNGQNEKGYFEKTIFNKNGVFVENIRKIANIDDNVLFRADDNEPAEDPEQENINRKRIELMNVPVSQHYVITSSGKIEKSSDIIDQFHDGLNDFNGAAGSGGGGITSHQQPVVILSTTSANNAGLTNTSSNTQQIKQHKDPHCLVMGKCLIFVFRKI